jgi:lipopolysaccharide transport system permease protein
MRSGSATTECKREHTPTNSATRLLSYRDLFSNLVVRDLKVRYKKSVLGFVWSLLNPLLMMVVYTIVFTILTSPNIENFPVFVLTGLMAWNFFASSITGASGTVVGNSTLINKVYFPRELLPASLVFSNLVNFLLTLIVLFGFIVAYRIPLTPMALYLPVITAIMLILTLGIALIVSSLNVFYRDVSMLVEVGIMAWFFLTPVFYQLERIPNMQVLGQDVWRWVYILNPMASIITDYRYVLLYNLPPINHTLFALGEAIFTLAVGYWLFHTLSPKFSEEL